MGHATHFLQRLKRLSTPQMEFAIELYRNSELIRFILKHSNLPDGAERIALAVENRPDTPHLIVARDGGFVTCLGEGMSIGSHPVVTRAQLRGLSKRFEYLREATERSQDRVQVQRLFRNLGNRGQKFTREDFQTLRAVMPLFEKASVSTIFAMSKHLDSFQNKFKRSAFRTMNKWVEKDLRYYWDIWWALGHLVALCGTRGRELVIDTSQEVLDEPDKVLHILSMLSVNSFAPAIVLRGGWAAARGGRRQVAHAKDILREAMSFVATLGGTVSLMVAALRHRSVRAEAEKLIKRLQRDVAVSMPPEDAVWSAMLLERWAALFEPDKVAESREQHRQLGADIVMHMCARLPDDHPERYEAVEDVPDELAYAVAMNVDDDMISNPLSLSLMTCTLPWIATADAAEFYLPARWVEIFTPAFQPSVPLAQLDAYHRYFLRDQPARAQAKIGRNQPCPCGSGNKYKRCCGR